MIWSHWSLNLFSGVLKCWHHLLALCWPEIKVLSLYNLSFTSQNVGYPTIWPQSSLKVIPGEGNATAVWQLSAVPQLGDNIPQTRKRICILHHGAHCQFLSTHSIWVLVISLPGQFLYFLTIIFFSLYCFSLPNRLWNCILFVAYLRLEDQLLEKINFFLFLIFKQWLLCTEKNEQIVSLTTAVEPVELGLDSFCLQSI